MTTHQTGFGATQCPYCGASTAGGHVCPKRPLSADVDDLGGAGDYGELHNTRYAGLEGTALQLAQNCDDMRDMVASLTDGEPTDDELEEMGMTREEFDDQYGDDPDSGTYVRIGNFLDNNDFDPEIRSGLRSRDYRSAEIMLSWGGPTIVFDTADREIKGSWGSDTWTSAVPGDASDQFDGYLGEEWEETR